jgi:hypothetical protein
MTELFGDNFVRLVLYWSRFGCHLPLTLQKIGVGWLLGSLMTSSGQVR